MKKYYKLLVVIILTFFTINQGNAQNTRTIVNGNVKDKNTNETLVGVNVVEVDENGRFVSGTISDKNGNFSLVVSSPDANIQISYLGYSAQTFKLDKKTRLDIYLEEESTLMEEVVVTAEKMGNDGIIAVRDRATAVTRVEMKDMDELVTTTVEEMLQGRMGGVDITAVSGDPGAGLNIRIRGTATLNAENDPLILVNNIPYDPNIENFDFATADIEKFGNLIDVSPEDIESIEVLKDAASTAQWGSKAANGILSIKTKRGRKSEPIFEYNYRFTRSKEPDPIPMLDGRDYSLLIKTEHYNANPDPTYRFYSSDLDPTPGDLDYYNYMQNTNWIKEITQVAYTHQHSFSVRGGGDKARYKVSLGYNDEQGTTIYTGLKKITVQTALDYDISSKLKFRTDIMYTHYDQDATYDQEDSYFKDAKSLRSVAYTKMPNLSVYERDTLNNELPNFFTPNSTLQGNAKEKYNPVAFATYGKHKRYQDNTSTGFNLKYSITHSLTFNGNITLNLFDKKFKKFLPYEAVGYNYDDEVTNQSYEEDQNKTTIITKNQLIFTPNISEKHNISILGQIFTENTIDNTNIIKTARASSNQDQDPKGDKDIIDMNAWSSEYRYLSTYMQLYYKFKDRYIITVGGLGEGSSKFSRESRYGFFPTASAAWRVSEEGFMSSLGFINDLKFRYSWGISGNAPRDNYLYFNKYEASADFAYDNVPGVRPSGIELTSLQWETIEQHNPGISLYAIDNRLNIEFDYYDKHTRDLYIAKADIPTTSGHSTINQNSGEMTNRGWEVNTHYDIVKRKNWKLSFNLNLAENKNIVLKIPKNFKLEQGDMLANGQYLNKIVPDRPIGGFYGYEYLGVYSTYEQTIALDENGNQIYDINGNPLYMLHGDYTYEYQPGDTWYKDQNNDGIINELDIVYLGSLNPDLMGGFGPRLEYKDFVVNGYFYFKVGQKIINQTRMDTENMHGYDNQSKATNHRWRTEGDETDMPRALYNEGFNYLGSTRFIEDGSFLRLKTVSLTYNMPKVICQKINFKNVRIFSTVYNLFTWTNYSGQDPDVAQPSDPKNLPKDTSKTPPSKKIIVGLTFTF